MAALCLAHGEREPTGDSAQFYQYVIQNDVDVSLAIVSYEHFNRVVKNVAANLVHLEGARSLCIRGEDDGVGTTEEDSLAWKETTWGEMTKQLGVDGQSQKTAYEPMFEIVAHEVIPTNSQTAYHGDLSIRWHRPTVRSVQFLHYAGCSVGGSFAVETRGCPHIEIDRAYSIRHSTCILHRSMVDEIPNSKLIDLSDR